MPRLNFAIPVLLSLLGSPATADGWTGGFERGSYYHVLRVDDLKLVVACDVEETRGPKSGYLVISAGNRKLNATTLRVTADGEAANVPVESGDTYEKRDPSSFSKATSLLASEGTVTLDLGGRSWSFRNPKPLNLHCKK